MDFAGNLLWINLCIFAGAAATVWLAGRRVVGFVDELAQRYNLSRALLGLFLLAGITSLPDIATSFTAAAHGNAELALNNLLGSVLLLVVVLAVADLVIGKQALTTVVPDALVLLQGSFNIVLLALVTVAITIGDIPLFGAGAWSWVLLGVAAYAAFKLIRADRQRKPWVINPDDEAVEENEREAQNSLPREHRDDSRLRLFARLALTMLVILLAGATLAYTGEAIGEQTGLGQSFAGLALMALSTSLPDISAIFASMRAGLYTMAISDVFGTNILNVALIGIIDFLDRSSVVLDEAGTFSALAAMLGILLTGLFMVGLSERADRTYLRMGADSIMVLMAYGIGMFFLFQLRDGA